MDSLDLNGLLEAIGIEHGFELEGPGEWAERLGLNDEEITVNLVLTYGLTPTVFFLTGMQIGSYLAELRAKEAANLEKEIGL